ncbi:MAG: hypothetical protein Q8Q46_03105 [Candidatus Giovannonibacteria bacterium]|nr:hypothetical protein [Candidatus Giovannonibacteria bacterium]
MTQEEKFVVNPLEKYFLNKKRSGAKWKIKDKPNYGSSATGWDLQVEHTNRVLLIEAKYIRGPFASALAGLTIAPLVNRPEKMKRSKYRSRYAVVCWAVGCGYKGGKRDRKYKMSGIYQILFDCFARNLQFWKYYSKILSIEYIFFVDKRKVAKINFIKIINLATLYKLSIDKSLHEMRLEAEKLLRTLEFK